MLSASLPIIAAWVNATVLFVAGFLNLANTPWVQKVYAEWDVSPFFYRAMGVVQIAAAIFLTAPELRLMGIALAAPIAFGSVVLLLDRRHYLQALPIVLLMAGLAAATLSVPSSATPFRYVDDAPPVHSSVLDAIFEGPIAAIMRSLPF